MYVERKYILRLLDTSYNSLLICMKIKGCGGMARKKCFLRLNVKGWSSSKEFIDKEVYKDLADVEVNPNTYFFFCFLFFNFWHGHCFPFLHRYTDFLLSPFQVKLGELEAELSETIVVNEKLQRSYNELVEYKLLLDKVI